MRSTILLLLSAVILLPMESQELDVPAADSLIPPRTFPWSTSSFDRSQIQRDPTRSLEGIMTLSPGVTKVFSQPRGGMTGGYSSYQIPTIILSNMNGLHARGSREGELEYRFGGFSVLDRWTNRNAIPFIPEMLEKVTVHTGAYGPTLGSMGGGVVDFQLRQAGDEFHAEAAFLTDDFAKTGEQFLNTSSYGWTTAVATLGTPLPFDTKLFVAGEISRQANRQPMYLSAFDVALAPDVYQYNWPYYDIVPGPLVVQRDHVPMQSAERTALQWNMTTSQLGFDFSFIGSVSSGKTREVSWPTALVNFYRQQRIPWIEENSTFMGVQVSTLLGRSARVYGSIGYQNSRSHTSDPSFGESWRIYSDSAANAAAGYPGFLTRYQGPKQYSAIAGFRFGASSSPNNSYKQQVSQAWKWSAGIDVGDPNAVSATILGEAEWWTIRKFGVNKISEGWRFDDGNEDGRVDRTFTSRMEEWVLAKKNWNIENYGFDIKGNEVDDGLDAPRRPSNMSLSVNSSWREDAFTINAGLRAVWFEMDMTNLPKQLNPATGGHDYHILDNIWDYNLNFFQVDKLTRTTTESYVLPRVSIERTTTGGRLFLSYGAFVEASPQEFLQLDDLTLATLLDPLRRVGYNFGGPAITFNVLASRTEQLEFGAEQQFGNSGRVRAAVYRKSLSRQVQLSRLRNTQDYPISVAFDNTGESTINGVEAGLTLDPAPGISLNLEYAWTSQQGYGSYPRSNQYYVTDMGGLYDDGPPRVLRPLTYERNHRVIGSVDIQPREGWFEGFRMHVSSRLESGTPYTQLEPIQNIGSSTVWNVGVRPFIDVRTTLPIEPVNASRTPWVTTLDVSASYEVTLGPASLTLFALVTNLLDTRNVINVYPTSGTATDDTWLQSPYASWITSYPQYEEFYRLINFQNRWAYMSATGNDIYGTPRQIRIGAKVAI